MEVWLDPDSPEMGYLVDQWLVSLRKGGMSARQLERVARRLGRATSQPLDHLQAMKKSVVESFQLWLHRKEKGTLMSNT